MKKIQHRGLLMSSINNIEGDTKYGGASSNNTGGAVRTKESTGVWDNEW